LRTSTFQSESNPNKIFFLFTLGAQQNIIIKKELNSRLQDRIIRLSIG